MRIVVNGEDRQCNDSYSLDELLREMGVKPDRSAVLVNDRVIARRARAELAIREGDRVEILVFAGGG